ncbi:K+-transporting ATPase ATPase F chain [Pseudomonas segetis]|uniref:K+-transporting ATPase ATPase F chain n=1 Tax=Pseudomonas segetis TaxID=298908 RepID=A0A239H7F7_9PSED|nr:K+-transporting ATPase ATPase F chain [Pseudomonas segetis]
MRRWGVFGAMTMSVLDGLSLCLALGLFFYLLLALMRAERG